MGLAPAVDEISADMLVDGNANVWAAPTAALEFAMPTVLNDSNRSPTFGCVKVAQVLQAWTPSNHVCASLALPTPPQFRNQEPPRPQQLGFPDFLTVPHLGHA